VSERPSTDADAASAGDDLVTVVSCMTEFEAASKVAVLEDAGIEAWTFGAHHSALPLSQRFLGVPVQVRAADLNRARTALDENLTDSPSIDWDSVDIGEREDSLPLNPPGRMPLPARIGFVLAMIILAITLAGLAWSAFKALTHWP
jgi:hypothetical protein